MWGQEDGGVSAWCCNTVSWAIQCDGEQLISAGAALPLLILRLPLLLLLLLLLLHSC
jgi:hypothetical protein